MFNRGGVGSEERGPLHGLDAVPTPVDAVPSSQQPVSGSLSYALPGEQQIDTHSTVRKGALGASGEEQYTTQIQTKPALYARAASYLS